MVSELTIGFVDNQQDISRQPFTQAVKLGTRDAGAGGVAGIGDEDDAGIRLDRSKQSIDRSGHADLGRGIVPRSRQLRGASEKRVGMGGCENRALLIAISLRQAGNQLHRAVAAENV